MKTHQSIVAAEPKGKSDTCAICKPNDIETQSIQEALLMRMKNVIQEGEQKITSEQTADESKTEFITFEKLIKMVFARKYKNFKPTISCAHAELKQDFCNQLLCTFKELDSLADKVGWKVAKYSFHLDVLGHQIKTYHRHFPTFAGPDEPKAKQKEKAGSQVAVRAHGEAVIKTETEYSSNVHQTPAFINQYRYSPNEMVNNQFGQPINYVWGYWPQTFEQQIIQDKDLPRKAERPDTEAKSKPEESDP